MLFIKENAEKIKGLIDELNENYKTDEHYSNINTCLVFYPAIMRVIEVVKRFNNISFSSGNIFNPSRIGFSHTVKPESVFRLQVTFRGNPFSLGYFSEKEATGLSINRYGVL